MEAFITVEKKIIMNLVSKKWRTTQKYLTATPFWWIIFLYKLAFGVTSVISGWYRFKFRVRWNTRIWRRAIEGRIVERLVVRLIVRLVVRLVVGLVVIGCEGVHADSFSRKVSGTGGVT